MATNVDPKGKGLSWRWTERKKIGYLILGVLTRHSLSLLHTRAKCLARETWVFSMCAGKSNEKLISRGGEENVRHDIALTTLRGEFPSKLCLYTCENRWPNYLVSHCAQLFPDMCGRPFTECERRVTMRTSPSRFYHPALAIRWELFAKMLIFPSCEILHITPWMTKLN